MNIQNLKAPLIAFHKQFITVGSPLPPTGKSLEVAKRIALVVAAPFAYLALIVLTVAEKISAHYWNNRAVAPVIQAAALAVPEIDREEFTAQKLDEIIGRITNDLRAQNNFHAQQKMRLFIDLTVDNVHKEKIFEIQIAPRETDELSRVIGDILVETIQYPGASFCKLIGFVKRDDGTFSDVHIDRDYRDKSTHRFAISKNRVSAENPSRDFERLLQMMHLPNEPRLHRLYQFNQPLLIV